MKSEKAKQAIKKHPSILGLFYVVIDELPEDQRADFRAWIYGQTQPVIEEEEITHGKIVDCAYSWDYELWYDYWIKGEQAPNDD